MDAEEKLKLDIAAALRGVLDAPGSDVVWEDFAAVMAPKITTLVRQGILKAKIQLSRAFTPHHLQPFIHAMMEDRNLMSFEMGGGQTWTLREMCRQTNRVSTNAWVSLPPLFQESACAAADTTSPCRRTPRPASPRTSRAWRARSTRCVTSTSASTRWSRPSSSATWSAASYSCS
jgi:hypothetical protein